MLTDVNKTWTTITIAAALALTACGRLERKGAPELREGRGEMLVLGDSLSTGAVTHPDFQLDYDDIVVRAIHGDRMQPNAAMVDGAPSTAVLAKPVRIGAPMKEVFSMGGDDKAAAALLKVIEWPELSWESQLGRREQRDVERIMIAARNGGRTADAKDEVDTWLKAERENGKTPTLPREIMVFFSGNDLCRAEDAHDGPTPPEQYRAGLKAAVEALLSGAQAPAEGTKLVFVSHLDILQLVRTPELFAAKRIKLTDTQGPHELSCAEFMKAHQDDRSIFTSKGTESALLRYTYHPMNNCHSVLAHAHGLDPAKAKVKLEDLEADMRAYREQLAALVDELKADQRLGTAGIEVKLVKATESLKVEPEDLANDCFHLSVAGQKKLSEAIQSEL